MIYIEWDNIFLLNITFWPKLLYQQWIIKETVTDCTQCSIFMKRNYSIFIRFCISVSFFPILGNRVQYFWFIATILTIIWQICASLTDTLDKEFLSSWLRRRFYSFESLTLKFSSFAFKCQFPNYIFECFFLFWWD